MKWELRKRLLLDKPDLSDLTDPLWVHCASVGEFNTVKPVLRELRKRFPILLTYFSPRAGDYLRSQRDAYDALHPLPLDVPFLVRRFEEIAKPRALLVVEREMWVSLVGFTRVKKILVNAYARGNFLEKILVPKYDLIVAKTERDAEILRREGAKKVLACGNLKLVREFRTAIPDVKVEEGFKTLVAGSTHRGEEEILLEIFNDLRNSHRLKLILAPRHVERSEDVKRLAERKGLKVSLRSKETCPWDVLIVDTLGELRDFYCLGDVAFVGGTFVPVGGHNLLEPAFCGKPVIFGPHTEKVSDLEDLVVETGYGFKADDPCSLKTLLKKLLREGFTPKEDLKDLSTRVKRCYLTAVLGELE